MQSGNNNKLKGKFIECCDCYTICPCWVKDRPDEDHCSSLYIWTFDVDAEIKGVNIGGKSVAAAAFHWGDGERQVAIYVDDRLEESTQKALIDAFSGKDETFKSLKSLAQLLGEVVDSGSASISHKLFGKVVDSGPTNSSPNRSNEKWEATVTVSGSHIAHAAWTEEPMEGRSQALTLNDTALDDELGIDGAVTLQNVDHFEMGVSPLPGGPFVYSGRSGMAAKFDYTKFSYTGRS